MKSTQETLKLFFIIWGVVLLLNQAVIFGGCFNPYCIAAAIPHTVIITFLLIMLIVWAEIKQHDEGQQLEPILNTEIGWIFKDKLIISKDEIIWENTTYSINEISKITWWVIDSDLGQFQFGNLYTIVFGNDKTTSTIKTKRKALHEEILKRLLPTVEKNITENMIAFFKRGDGKIYNNATIWDNGVDITKKGGWFTADIKKRFAWNELLVIYGKNGNITIESFLDSTFKVTIADNMFNLRFLEKLVKKIQQNTTATKISDLYQSIDKTTILDILAEKKSQQTNLFTSQNISKTQETNKNNENLNELDFDKSYFKNLKKMKETNNKQSLSTQHENTSYSKYIQSIDVPNFEKIRRYCNNLADENKADEMQKYLAENGKMYKAIIYDALEQFITQIDGETLTIVDWGCSQGIASMLVLDYIREKQLDIDVAKVILIDDDDLKLNRAIIQTKIFTNDATEILKLNIQDDTINDTTEDIFTDNVLNLFANDKENVHPESLNDRYADQSYFMCVSSQDNETIDNIQNEIEMINDIRNISNRDGKIGKFQRYERIFQVKSKSEYQVPKYRVPIIDIDDDEIPF